MRFALDCYCGCSSGEEIVEIVDHALNHRPHCMVRTFGLAPGHVTRFTWRGFGSARARFLIHRGKVGGRESYLGGCGLSCDENASVPLVASMASRADGSRTHVILFSGEERRYIVGRKH